MTIIVKIMSSQDMGDRNNSKDFRIVPITPGSNFKFERNPVTGYAHLIIDENGSYPGIRYPITGNVYVTENNKIILHYAYSRVRYAGENPANGLNLKCSDVGVALNNKTISFLNSMFSSLNELPTRELKELDTSFEFPLIRERASVFDAVEKYLLDHNLYCEFYACGEGDNEFSDVRSGYIRWNGDNIVEPLSSPDQTKPVYQGKTTLYTEQPIDKELASWRELFISSGGNSDTATALVANFLLCYPRRRIHTGELYSLMEKIEITEQEDVINSNIVSCLPFDIVYQKERDPETGKVSITGFHMTSRKK